MITVVRLKVPRIVIQRRETSFVNVLRLGIIGYGKVKFRAKKANKHCMPNCNYDSLPELKSLEKT